MSPYRISRCPACDQPLPESAKGLVAARVQRAATVNVRSADASRNELATALAAANAEDVVDPRSAYTDPRRSVEFVECRSTPEIAANIAAMQQVMHEAKRATMMPAEMFRDRGAKFQPTPQNVVDSLRAIEDIAGEEPDPFDADWEGGTR